MNYIAPPSARATYQDLLDAPEGMVAEIIRGELRLQPRPGGRHIRSEGRLFSQIDRPFMLRPWGPGSWTILQEPKIEFDEENVYDPDIAGWRFETMPQLPETSKFTTTPDWVCEVLSPSTYRTDRTSKKEVYAQHGVGHYWIIDPRAMSLEVFELRSGRWVELASASGEEVVSFAPFEDIQVDLSYLWPKHS